MDVEFADKDLQRLATDPQYEGDYAASIVRAFRKVLCFIQAAVDERDLHAMKSLRFEKLKGDREGERSMRLNKQWRLILKIKPGQPKNVVVICAIEDYH